MNSGRVSPGRTSEAKARVWGNTQHSPHTAFLCCVSAGVRRGQARGKAAASQSAIYHAGQEVDFIPGARGSKRKVLSRRVTWSNLC